MVVTVKQQKLHNLLLQGYEQVQKYSCHTLISQVTRIATIDPLSLFHYGAEAFNGERFYWADPDDQLVLVGLGTATTFKAEKADRFFDINKRWEELLKNSVVDLDSSLQAAGPLLFGGFTFDPLKPKSGLWRSFPDAVLVLPKFLMTMTQGECWLTVNHVLRLEDDPIQEANRLTDERDHLLNHCHNATIDHQSMSYTYQEIYPDQWKNAVEDMATEIRAGVLDKIVLTRQLRAHSANNFSPAKVLQQLRTEQRDSFTFAIEHEDSCFLGASPERLVKRVDDKLLSTCLAGSIGRGTTIEEDLSLEKNLLNDKKNKYEHTVVVKMIADAMKDVCQQIEIPKEPQVYKVRDLQHLYTPVIGKACKDTSLLSVLERLHPTPALGGFPKEQAMEKIREIESHQRGWYAAPVGWIDYKGDGEFSAAIRSGLLQGNQATLFAGAGIVADSKSEVEYEETKMKFRSMLSALGRHVS